MSPIGLGSTFGIASEFTNEIYDISNEANQAAYKDGADTWTMILGIVVTLLPKVLKDSQKTFIGLENEMKLSSVVAKIRVECHLKVVSLWHISTEYLIMLL